MENPKKIHFLVANYSNLQGLKSLPIGLIGIYSAFWANQNIDNLFALWQPFIWLAVMFGLMYAIERWYKRTFGDIRRTRHDYLVDLLLMVAGAILAMVVLLLENSFHLRGCLIGIAFAVGLVGDYARSLIAIGERNIWLFPVPPITGILMVLISFLPFLGIEWWQFFGLKYPVFGVVLTMGVLVIISSISSHIYLLRSLHHSPEAQNGHAI